MAPITRQEYDHLPDHQKRDVIWKWLETLDAGVQRAMENHQLLYERVRKVEASLAEIAARPPP
jgi:predicted ATP-grasp superfamily ATP-dependent carboligase